ARAAGGDGERPHAVIKLRDGGDRLDRLHVDEVAEVELLLLFGDGGGIERQPGFAREQLDDLRRRYTPERVEAALGKAEAVFEHGGRPCPEVRGHGVHQCSITIEDQGVEPCVVSHERAGPGCGSTGRRYRETTCSTATGVASPDRRGRRPALRWRDRRLRRAA